MPAGVDATEPRPTTVATKSYLGAATGLNVALTRLAPFSVTAHSVVAPLQLLLPVSHPTNWKPVAGVAVNVTEAP
jgi:hypothetical protein